MAITDSTAATPTTATNATNATTTTTETSSTAETPSSYYNYSSSSSDIDWNGLIEAAVSARTLPADTIDTKISKNESKIAAYEEMQSLMQDIVDAAEIIRGTPDSLTANDDAFSLREAYLTGYGDVNAESAVVVTAAPDAELTSYDLKVRQIATAQKVAGFGFSGKTTDMGLSGTFTIGLENAKKPAEIEIKEDMTLAEIAEAINLKSEDSGVTASVLQVGEGEFRVVLSASETGQEIKITDPSGDDNIPESIGLVTTDGSWVRELQKPQGSIVELNGVVINRSSNTLNDVIDDVSITLYQETPDDASINIEISHDLPTIKSGITALVEAYNAYRDWAMTQAETNNTGGASADAVLFGDSTLRSGNRAVASALATVINKESMKFVGLTYDENNKLQINEKELNEALLENLEEVEAVLAFTYTSDSDDIVVLSRTANMPGDLSMDIEVDDEGNMSRVSVHGDDTLFTIDENRIKGAEGTLYEGITFVFTGDESQTINMTFTAGIFEKVYTVVDSFSNGEDGRLSKIMVDLAKTNDDLAADAADIRSRAETYRARLTALYAEYQAQIEIAQSNLDYLEALLDSGD